MSDALPEVDAAALAARVAALGGLEPSGDGAAEPSTTAEEDAETRRLVSLLGGAGLLEHLAPSAFGGARPTVQNREVCAIREALAFRSGIADSAFVMQGLGSAAITLRGTDTQRRAYLPALLEGRSLAAFALTEPGAGSDLGAISTTARRDGGAYVIDGGKTLISNAGIAAFYTLVARTSDDRRRGLSCFIVEAGDPGLSIQERLRGMAPHPIGALGLAGCRVPIDRRIGEEGDGLSVALDVLNFYRPTVGAAAVGLARRAMAESIEHLKERRQFGGVLGDLQGLRAMLADMAVEIEAAAALVERASASIDAGSERPHLESAMAKYFATEAAQRVVDRAVQMRGGMGVIRGSVVERLYREVRALRIYEGASEVQKNVIAREVLRT